jgi:hypothetical protein
MAMLPLLKTHFTGSLSVSPYYEEGLVNVIGNLMLFTSSTKISVLDLQNGSIINVIDVVWLFILFSNFYF